MGQVQSKKRSIFIILITSVMMIYLLLMYGCGYRALYYDSSPTVTVEFIVRDDAYKPINDVIVELAREKKLKRFSERDVFSRSAYNVMVWNNHYDIYATSMAYSTNYNLIFSKARMPWRRPTNEETEVLARQFSAALTAIDGVTEVGFLIIDHDNNKSNTY